MTNNQKLTKRRCDSAAPTTRADGKPRETVLWDAGDGAVKGFGLRVSVHGARSFIVMYRAGKGRSAPLRKVTIGTFGSPWTVETGRTEAHRILSEVRAGRDPAKSATRKASKAAPAGADSVKAAIEEWFKRDQAEKRNVAEVRRIVNRDILP